MKKYFFIIGAVLGVALLLFAFTVNSKKANLGGDKVVICHIPPGNPANEHTIEVGAAAVRAHLDHGDHLGQCSCECGGEGDQ